MKKLLLIDANSIIHRCFHALPPLSTPDGRPIQAVYGLSNIFLRMWREERPAFAAALFDRPEPTFRKKKYKEYKGQRPPTPSELISQIIEAHEFFKQFGIATFEKPGYEADDCIATLAEKFKNGDDLQVIILTGDADTLQLVESDRLVVRTFRKGISDTIIYDEPAVKARYGLHPNQLVDYKALVGDPSDNIKGVPGVGPKTAAELLQRHGNLEHLLAHASPEDKLEKKVVGFREQAEFAKSLVILDRQVPLEIDSLNELRIEDHSDAPVAYFKTLGFESLLKRFGAEQGLPLPPPEPSLSKKEKPKLLKTDNLIFLTDENLERRDLYNSPKSKVGFDLKTTLKALWTQGTDLVPPYFDLGIAFWLLDSDFREYDPEMTFKKFLRKEWGGKEEDFVDAYQFTNRMMDEYEVRNVFQDIEMPLLRVLGTMEHQGIQIDRGQLKSLESKFQKKLEVLTKEIYKAAEEEFNINSPQQLGKILFIKLALGGKGMKRTGGGQFSTNAEILELLRDAHPIIPKILEYREYFKLQSTYIRPLQELTDKKEKLHTDFIQTGSATGRISSQAPNLQNIPKGASWANDLRAAFVAKRGYSLVSFDYSQMELRILAALSGDKNMKEAFLRGDDVHRITAAKVFHMAPEKVGDAERRVAKVLNFGLAYGMGVNAFAKAGNLKRAEAQTLIKAYFEEFHGVRTWQEETKRKVRELGYVKTRTGRRRYLPDIASGSPRFVADAERAAINQPVQGLEADIVKMAMIEIDKKIKEKEWEGDARMVLTIHDELLFEIRDDMIRKITPLVKRIMEEIYPLEVPLVVDVSSGKNWGHLTKFLL